MKVPPSLYCATDSNTDWTHQVDGDSLLLTLICKEVDQEKLLKNYLLRGKLHG